MGTFCTPRNLQWGAWLSTAPTPNAGIQIAIIANTKHSRLYGNLEYGADRYRRISCHIGDKEKMPQSGIAGVLVEREMVSLSQAAWRQ